MVVLDADPYNQFNLMCQVETAQEVTSQKQVIWRMQKTGSNNLSTLMTDKSADIAIMNEELENGILKSVLVGFFNVSGEYHFYCNGFLNIIEDKEPPSRTRETVINVKGTYEKIYDHYNILCI